MEGDFLGNTLGRLGPGLQELVPLRSREGSPESGSQIDCGDCHGLTPGRVVHSKTHLICPQMEYIRTVLALCH